MHKQSLNKDDSDDDERPLISRGNIQLQVEQPVEISHQFQKQQSALSASGLDLAAVSSHLRHVKLRVACAFGVDFYMLPA